MVDDEGLVLLLVHVLGILVQDRHVHIAHDHLQVPEQHILLFLRLPNTIKSECQGTLRNISI